MKIPRNTFLDALRADRAQFGLWLGFADAGVAEALAGCGFDWLLIDGEHAPNDLRSVLAQLRALAPHAVQPIVRLAEPDEALVKPMLELGAQTLMVPMVDTPEQAARMARAMRYPPEGTRGIGASLARASRWNQVEHYLDDANAQMALLVQAETVQAMANLAAIAAVDGVDGVFFGPADLSASMGLRGQPTHPAVRAAIVDGIATVRAAGKAAGVIATEAALARDYVAAGARFVAVGIDTALLVDAATALARAFVPTDAR